MIKWTTAELDTIDRYGEVSTAMARTAMERSGLSFDDVERINGHYESHEWGSNTDRAYRKAAIKKAIAKVAADPRAYGIDPQGKGEKS